MLVIVQEGNACTDAYEGADERFPGGRCWEGVLGSAPPLPQGFAAAVAGVLAVFQWGGGRGRAAGSSYSQLPRADEVAEINAVFTLELHFFPIH